MLIHVGDPRAVVKEMVRELKPGGRLLLVELNNLTTSTTRDVHTPGFALDRVLSVFKPQALCERGKHGLGLGHRAWLDGIEAETISSNEGGLFYGLSARKR